MNEKFRSLDYIVLIEGLCTKFWKEFGHKLVSWQLPKIDLGETEEVA